MAKLQRSAGSGPGFGEGISDVRQHFSPQTIKEVGKIFNYNVKQN